MPTTPLFDKSGSESGTIDLPAPVTDTGPTATVDGASVTRDGTTLAFGAAAGASMYNILLTDDSGRTGRIVTT